MNHRVFLVIDLDRCWGCKACEVACKQELALGVGPRPMRVMETGARMLEGVLHRDFVPTLCQHCDQPACLKACPADAIYTETDGSIQVRNDRCTGCGACATACAFGAVEIDGASEKPVKCTLCRERRGEGSLPSCAQHCIGRAIILAKEYQWEGLVEGRHYWKTGRIVYVSDKWSHLGVALQAG
jgi:Fe-S-cluster-containing dehydrogenase component